MSDATSFKVKSRNPLEHPISIYSTITLEEKGWVIPDQKYATNLVTIEREADEQCARTKRNTPPNGIDL